MDHLPGRAKSLATCVSPTAICSVFCRVLFRRPRSDWNTRTDVVDAAMVLIRFPFDQARRSSHIHFEMRPGSIRFARIEGDADGGHAAVLTRHAIRLPHASCLD